jgi:hypothetical protein
MYSLFIGFRKLGEFSSIFEAKKFAQESKLSGVFNLIGENYRDAWYVFEHEARKEKSET